MTRNSSAALSTIFGRSDMILAHGTLRVLFLCTGNSARSQMAEGLLRKLSRGRADVVSAGTKPEPEVHPLAADVLRTGFHVDTDGLQEPVEFVRLEYEVATVAKAIRASELPNEFADDIE